MWNSNEVLYLKFIGFGNMKILNGGRLDRFGGSSNLCNCLLTRNLSYRKRCVEQSINVMMTPLAWPKFSALVENATLNVTRCKGKTHDLLLVVQEHLNRWLF